MSGGDKEKEIEGEIIKERERERKCQEREKRQGQTGE